MEGETTVDNVKIGCRLSIGDTTVTCYRYRTRGENAAACIRAIDAAYAAGGDNDSEPDWAEGEMWWFTASGAEGGDNARD